MHPQAAAAIRAAKNRPQWGRWATFKFLQRNAVPTVLYAIALSLEVGRTWA